MKQFLLLSIFSAALSAAPVLMSAEPQNDNVQTGGFPRLTWNCVERADKIIIERELAGTTQRDTLDWSSTSYIDQTILPNKTYSYSLFSLTGDVESERSNLIEYSTENIDVEYLLNEAALFVKSSSEALNIILNKMPLFEINGTLQYRPLNKPDFTDLKPFVSSGIDSLNIVVTADNFELLQGYEFRVSLQSEAVNSQPKSAAHFYHGDVEKLTDLSDWSQYEKIIPGEQLSSLSLIENSTVLWFDTCVLVREFESSLTLISLKNPQAPVATKIIQGDFAARDNMWQMGNLLISSQLDAQKRLQFVTARFTGDTIEIIDTLTYSEKPFETHMMSQIKTVDDSTALISMRTDWSTERIMLITKTADAITVSNYFDIDRGAHLTLESIPDINIPLIKVWAGFSDYHSSYIVCREQDGIKPVLVANDLVSYNYDRSVSNGTIIDDPQFSGGRVDTNSHSIHLVKTIDINNKKSFELQTYSYAAGTVAISGSSDTKGAGVGIRMAEAQGNITIEGVGSESYNINIFSLTGRVLLSQEISQESNRVNISSLAKGTYLIGIRGGRDQKSMVAKFVKE